MNGKSPQFVRLLHRRLIGAPMTVAHPPESPRDMRCPAYAFGWRTASRARPSPGESDCRFSPALRSRGFWPMAHAASTTQPAANSTKPTIGSQSGAVAHVHEIGKPACLAATNPIASTNAPSPKRGPIAFLPKAPARCLLVCDGRVTRSRAMTSTRHRRWAMPPRPDITRLRNGSPIRSAIIGRRNRPDGISVQRPDRVSLFGEVNEELTRFS